MDISRLLSNGSFPISVPKRWHHDKHRILTTDVNLSKIDLGDLANLVGEEFPNVMNGGFANLTQPIGVYVIDQYFDSLSKQGLFEVVKPFFDVGEDRISGNKFHLRFLSGGKRVSIVNNVTNKETGSADRIIEINEGERTLVVLAKSLLGGGYKRSPWTCIDAFIDVYSTISSDKDVTVAFVPFISRDPYSPSTFRKVRNKHILGHCLDSSVDNGIMVTSPFNQEYSNFAERLQARLAINDFTRINQYMTANVEQDVMLFKDEQKARSLIVPFYEEISSVHDALIVLATNLGNVLSQDNFRHASLTDVYHLSRNRKTTEKRLRQNIRSLYKLMKDFTAEEQISCLGKLIEYMPVPKTDSLWGLTQTVTSPDIALPRSYLSTLRILANDTARRADSNCPWNAQEFNYVLGKLIKDSGAHTGSAGTNFPIGLMTLPGSYGTGKS